MRKQAAMNSVGFKSIFILIACITDVHMHSAEDNSVEGVLFA